MRYEYIHIHMYLYVYILGESCQKWSDQQTNAKTIISSPDTLALLYHYLNYIKMMSSRTLHKIERT